VKIEQEQIIQTALALLDEDGLEAFNMRTLAQRIGVQASAIYWHVAGKAELFSLMAGTFYDKAFASVPSGLPWREWLFRYGTALRAALLAHRDSALLCVNAKPEKYGREKLELLASPLVEAGLSRKQALSYQSTVIFLVLGTSAYEQSAGLHDYLATNIGGFDHAFTQGLTAMVSGFLEEPDEESASSPQVSRSPLRERKAHAGQRTRESFAGVKALQGAPKGSKRKAR
jgi:TetR/AcrR family transcriptional regulator, tetracycline repressor protein